MRQTTYRLEARDTAPVQPAAACVSRGETRADALLAFDAFVDADARGERQFAPGGGLRLVVLADAR